MANEQKINEVWDIPALEAQRSKVIGLIKETISEMEKANATKVTFSGDAKNINEATKITSEYNKQYEKTIQLTGQLNNLKSQEGQIEEKIQQAQKETIKNQKLQTAATNELSGAWERARAKGQLLDKQARDLGFSMYELEKAGKKGTAEYQKLETEFNKVSKEAFEFNAEIKKVDASINIHSKNVGNYDGAITSLRQEIKNLTQALATMEMQGKNNTNEYKTMVSRLGELKDAVGDVQARSKFFADDARYLNTVTQAVQGVVGAYSVWVGASELLGTKNEELEKIMRKMMALMTVMQGLSQVQKALDKDSYVRVAAQLILDKARVYWTGIQTAATGSGTIAQKAFNVAVKANPIGLLVTAIVAAAAAMFAYGRRVSDVTKIENDWVDTNKEIKKTYSERKTDIETYVSIAKNANKSDEQRLLALKKLNEETKGVINVTDLSTGSLKKLDTQTGIYLETLYKQIKLEAASQKIKDLQSQTFDLQAENMKIANEINAKNMAQVALAMSPLEATQIIWKTINDEQYRGKTTAEALILLRTEENKKQIELNNTLEKGILNYINENTFLSDNTKEKEANIRATEKQNKALEKQPFITTEQAEAILQLMELRKEGNKVLSETEQLELDEAETLRLAGEQVQKLMEALRNSQPAANEFLDWWKSLTDLEKAKNIVDLFSKLTGVVSDFSEISDENGKKEVENFKLQQDDKLRVLNERLRLGLISEEQYMADKSDLELEFEAKKKEIEKREFARKKKLAYAEAIINGASAAISALTEKTLAMKIISLAFVALTLAAQLSKIQSSTPGYAKGRKDGPGEFAKVGEQGWEYTGTGTDIFKTPNSTTLTYLQPHQWVMPHAQSVQLEKSLKMPGVNMPVAVKENKQNDDILYELKRLNKKPTAIINMDKHGIRAGIIAGNSFINYVNNNLTMKR